MLMKLVSSDEILMGTISKTVFPVGACLRTHNCHCQKRIEEIALLGGFQTRNLVVTRRVLRLLPMMLKNLGHYGLEILKWFMLKFRLFPLNQVHFYFLMGTDVLVTD